MVRKHHFSWFHFYPSIRSQSFLWVSVPCLPCLQSPLPRGSIFSYTNWNISSIFLLFFLSNQMNNDLSIFKFWYPELQILPRCLLRCPTGTLHLWRNSNFVFSLSTRLHCLRRLSFPDPCMGWWCRLLSSLQGWESRSFPLPQLSHLIYYQIPEHSAS